MDRWTGNFVDSICPAPEAEEFKFVQQCGERDRSSFGASHYDLFLI